MSDVEDNILSKLRDINKTLKSQRETFRTTGVNDNILKELQLLQKSLKDYYYEIAGTSKQTTLAQFSKK
jgi:hypothetical protein